jgi:hypothetical protein
MFVGFELLAALGIVAGAILIFRRLKNSRRFAQVIGEPDEAEILQAVDDALAVAADCAEELEQQQIEKAIVLKELRRKVRR